VAGGGGGLIDVDRPGNAVFLGGQPSLGEVPEFRGLSAGFGVGHEAALVPFRAALLALGEVCSAGGFDGDLVGSGAGLTGFLHVPEAEEIGAVEGDDVPLAKGR
jgi:hypothetical protein